jgi:DNA sulfur modification protein DndB
MQQMFIDLQKGTQVNKSLQLELSGEIDAKLVREVRDSIPFFKNYTVSDETSIGKGSKKIFTLKSFYEANKYVFGSRLTKKNYDETKTFLTEFWDVTSKSIPAWAPFVERGGLDTDEFRSDSLSHLSVTMHALGMIASRLHHEGYSLSRSLPRLQKANFKRGANSPLERKYGSAVITKDGQKVVKPANNKNVRLAIREYLWEKVLGYKKLTIEGED